jgi:hypothetical protein
MSDEWRLLRERCRPPSLCCFESVVASGREARMPFGSRAEQAPDPDSLVGKGKCDPLRKHKHAKAEKAFVNEKKAKEAYARKHTYDAKAAGVPARATEAAAVVSLVRQPKVLGREVTAGTSCCKEPQEPQEAKEEEEMRVESVVMLDSKMLYSHLWTEPGPLGLKLKSVSQVSLDVKAGVYVAEVWAEPAAFPGSHSADGPEVTHAGVPPTLVNTVIVQVTDGAGNCTEGLQSQSYNEVLPHATHRSDLPRAPRY